MLTWPAKDPDEKLDYRVDWTARLASDVISVSDWFLVTAAGLAIDSNLFTDKTSTVWLTGGTAGETAVIVNRVTTTEGRIFEETITLPIVATTTAAPPTGYTEPGAADLKARFPAFAAVDPSVIDSALVEAARQVDTSWLEGDFIMGRLLYAAHVLTLDGHGTGAEAQMALAGTLGFKTMRSGALTLERFGGKDDAADLDATAYGKRFAKLRRQNFAGPITLTGASVTPSHLAKDWG